MHGEQFPFYNLPRCWRLGDIEETQLRASDLLKSIKKASQTAHISSGTDIQEGVNLVEGWSKPEDWGVWSLGKDSVIRLCIPHHRISDDVGFVRLIVTGHYYGENKATSITVNALDFGEQNLSDDSANLVVPLTDLRANGMIEVTFSHQQPISPFDLKGARDIRQLAFAITRIGYTLVQTSQVP